MGIVLFTISFLLIFISSYFLTSLISPKKSILGFIYLFLISFAQIVLTFEILSLFTAIKEVWVLSLNMLFFASSFYYWNKKSKPLWSLDCTNFRRRILNSFKLDKSLILLSIGFLIFITSAVVLCTIMPITSGDGQTYHVARSLFWVLQGNLNHFDFTDIRALCFPINSEILYSWILLFIKKDVFLGFFSFVGYLLSIISVYNILGLLGYCMRRKLWVIFILSSFASVIVQVSGTETDIIVAGLISSSIFLFWSALKNNKKIPIFMSALAYALAIGTKTTSIIAIPGVGLFLLGLCFYYKKYKPFALFICFGILNFLIFSSYNYILNFLQFSNFIGGESIMLENRNYYGLKAIPANFIKYIFMFIDFTGLDIARRASSHIIELRNVVLNHLNLGYISDGICSSIKVTTGELIEPLMGAGILGLLVYLPCSFWAFIKPAFRIKSKKTWFIFGFASLFIINLVNISYLLAYMVYSVRFIMFFMILSSPVLVYSYFKKNNLLKFIIIFYSVLYLVVVSTHLRARPLINILQHFKTSHSISKIRENITCKNSVKEYASSQYTCLLTDKIRNKLSKENKILALIGYFDYDYELKSLNFDGYNVDFRRLEDVDKIDFNKYNVIIASSKGQYSTLIKHYEERKNRTIIKAKKFISFGNTFVPCIYLKNPKIPKKFTHPYIVICAMTKPFLDKNDLTLIYNIESKDESNKKVSYYHIYRNKNLPLFLKSTN